MGRQINNVCTICGHKCKPRGLGAHMRLKHGIKVETVVRQSSDLSNSSQDVKKMRPSDYLSNKKEVVEVKIVEAAPQRVPEPAYKFGSNWSRENQDRPGVSEVSKEGYELFQRMMKKQAEEDIKDKCSGSAGEQPGPEATDRH